MKHRYTLILVLALLALQGLRAEPTFVREMHPSNPSPPPVVLEIAENQSRSGTVRVFQTDEWRYNRRKIEPIQQAETLIWHVANATPQLPYEARRFHLSIMNTGWQPARAETRIHVWWRPPAGIGSAGHGELSEIHGVATNIAHAKVNFQIDSAPPGAQYLCMSPEPQVELRAYLLDVQNVAHPVQATWKNQADPGFPGGTLSFVPAQPQATHVVGVGGLSPGFASALATLVHHAHQGPPATAVYPLAVIKVKIQQTNAVYFAGNQNGLLSLNLTADSYTQHDVQWYGGPDNEPLGNGPHIQFNPAPWGIGHHSITARSTLLTNCFDTVQVTVSMLDFQFEDLLDQNDPPPAMLFVNRVDLDKDGIPDYADEHVEASPVIRPALLRVHPPLPSWDDVTFTFEYGGSPQQPSFDGAPIPGSEYIDYSGAKTGTIRIWNLEDPPGPRTGDNYIWFDIPHTAVDDFDFDGEKRFWIEGINPGQDTIKVSMTITGQDPAEWHSADREVRIYEPRLGLNTSNSSPNKRPGTPSVIFDSGHEDFLVKDQQHGFRWWWARTNNDTGLESLTHSNIPDNFPFFIEIPQEVRDRGYHPYLSVHGGITIYAYRMPSDAADMRVFLQNIAIASAQLNPNLFAAAVGNAVKPIALPNNAGRANFIARAYGNGQQQATLFLWLKGPDNEYVPVDSWRLTLQNDDQFWAFYSLRDQADGNIPYPVEDEREIEMPHYGPAQQIGGFRDPQKKHYLLMVHGYNNTVNDARRRYNEIWKRLFWLGFRGQFVGVTWHGNVGVWPVSTLRYDSSTRNAFQSAHGFREFLAGEVKSWADGSAGNVDVMAHSLGNLLVWEALRYNQAKQPGSLFRNMINVQAAVWPETFHPANDFVYADEPDPANNITYTVEEQKQHSWRFWFNQPDHPADQSLGGSVVNSYINDKSLHHWMRGNCNSRRGGSHYTREKYPALFSNGPTPGHWRAPLGTTKTNGWGTAINSPVVNILHSQIPVFMRAGHRIVNPNYNREHLKYPVGNQTHPLDEAANISAITHGWRNDQHSDFAVGEKSNADADMWFPKIWPWFEQITESSGYITINKE